MRKSRGVGAPAAARRDDEPAAGGTLSVLPAGPVVKICGLTRSEDVRLAAAMGAWAVGFVFAPSPRRMEAAEAAQLIEEAAAAVAEEPGGPVGAGAGLAVGPLTVGVFGDVGAGEIVRVVEEVGLDAVQLHGGRGPSAPEVREALRGFAPPHRLTRPGTQRPDEILIIRVVGVDPRSADPDELRRSVAAAQPGADLLLLDTRAGGRSGGTGEVFPWGLAAEVSAAGARSMAAPAFRSAAASGGSGPGGPPILVAGGIRPGNVREALECSGAWGVDVSSGVERTLGMKDPEAVKQLIEVVNGVRRARAAVLEAGPADAQKEGSTK